MKYFKRIQKGWQGIIFFALLGGMLTYIFLNLNPNNYIGEIKILIISHNILKDNYSSQKLANVMEKAIKSDSFKKDLQNESGNLNGSIKTKIEKQTGILQVEIIGSNPKKTKYNIEKIQQNIANSFKKYYSLQDNISVKSITVPKVVNLQKVTFKIVSYGVLIGWLVGFVIVILTGLELFLFPKSNKKNLTIKQKLEKQLFKEQKKINFNDINNDINIEYQFKNNKQLVATNNLKKFRKEKKIYKKRLKKHKKKKELIKKSSLIVDSKPGEASSEEIKKRLNKLLKGEL